MTCQTCSEPPSFFLHVLCEIELSLQSRALGTFCRPHLPKVLRAQQFFLRFYVINYLMMMMMRLTYEIERLLQYRAPFADLIFQKWSEPLSFFFIVKWQSSSRYTISCTFYRPHIPKVLQDRQFFTILI